MSSHSQIQANPPARTHAEAAALFRRTAAGRQAVVHDLPAHR